jgi:DNA mismatch repair protein MutS2
MYREYGLDMFARLDAENVRFEDVLTRLDQQRQEMEAERAEAKRLKLEMEQSASKAREYREKLEAERAKVVEKAQAEARAIIEEARAASDLALAELKEIKKRQDKLDWQQVNDSRAEARRLLNEAERNIGGPAQEPEAPPPTRDAAVGDTVELLKMGTKATVLSVNKDGTLQLQAGILKISAKQSEVRVVEGETETQKATRKIIARAERTIRTAAVPSEIDLRGMMTDEAVMAVERFLDTAMMGKLETATIIHGKGTGAVRNAVRSYLKRSRYVKAFRPGRYGEGEDGVTVVTLK